MGVGRLSFDQAHGPQHRPILDALEDAPDDVTGRSAGGLHLHGQRDSCLGEEYVYLIAGVKPELRRALPEPPIALEEFRVIRHRSL